MKARIIGALALASCVCSIANASIVTVTYDINLTSRTENNMPVAGFTPFSGAGSVTYDDSYGTIVNSPGYTRAGFGLQSDTGYQGPSSATVVTSPITQYIPLGLFDRISTNVAVNLLYSTEPMGVSSVSIGSWANHSGPWENYNYFQYLSVPIVSNDLNGDGISDVGSVSAAKLVNFWNNHVGGTFSFSEGYTLQTGPDAVTGDSWFGTFRITSVGLSDPLPGAYPGTTYVYNEAGAVPSGAVSEPASIALFASGLGLLWRRRNASRRRQ